MISNNEEALYSLLIFKHCIVSYLSHARESAEKLDACLFEKRVERVFLRNFYLQTLGVSKVGGKDTTILLWLVPCLRIKGSRGESEIMVHELSPSEEEEGNRVVVISFISVYVGGDFSWVW